MKKEVIHQGNSVCGRTVSEESRIAAADQGNTRGRNELAESFWFVYKTGRIYDHEHNIFEI